METTEMIFILDRSGSMQGLENDTIGGFNSLIKKQRKEKGKAYITTVLFDNKIDILYESVKVENVKSLTNKEYYVRGTTALLDAIGYSLKIIKKKQKERKTDHVVFVINTDGYENASQYYTYKKINNMINKAKSQYHWEFVFLGARIDVVKEAGKLGIDETHVAKYYEDSQGIEACYQSANAFLCLVRKDCFDSSWKKSVKQNYKIK